MKKEIKKNPCSVLVLAEAIPVLDGQGLSDDAVFLTEARWEVTDNLEDHATFCKSSGVLRLRASQDEENEHRVKWELSIHTAANQAQVGYASIVLRPGDMNDSVTKRLIDEAVKAGEEEFKTWSDALAEARSILQA